MTLAQQLTDLIQDKTDLYKTLGFTQPINKPQFITVTQLRQNYRRLALRYHPDKNLREGKYNSNLSDQFHRLSLAIQILQDVDLRRQYDSWYVNTYIPRRQIDIERKELIDKLEREENRTDNGANQNKTGPSFVEVQRYGELLRKLKHFNRGYGNWRDLEPVRRTEDVYIDLDTDAVNENECQYPESATIRVELLLRGNNNNNNNTEGTSTKESLLERDRLLDYLDSTIKLVDRTRLQDVYYSSRNVCQSDNDTTGDSLVCYLVFKTVEDAYRFYKSTATSTTTTTATTVIKRVSPRVPVEYYRHSAVIELDDEIREKLRDGEKQTKTVKQ